MQDKIIGIFAALGFVRNRLAAPKKNQLLFRIGGMLIAFVAAWCPSGRTSHAEVVKGYYIHDYPCTDPSKRCLRINYEFPFNTGDPTDFANFFNQRTWDDGTEREFINIRNCGLANPGHGYNCKADVRETSVLGTRLCNNYSLSYYAGYAPVTSVGMTWDKKAEYYYSPSSSSMCGPWEKVAETPPEPQPTPTPEPAPPSSPEQPAPKPTPAADTPTFTREQIAIGGGTLFLIGGILGAAIGFSAAKNKSSWKEL